MAALHTLAAAGRALTRALDALANRHKAFRRGVLIWALCLITWTVREVFLRSPDIQSGTATALGLVIGILATVIGFYQWSRDREDRNP